MLTRPFALASAVVVVAAGASSALASFETIDLSSSYNIGHPALGFGTYPGGAQTLGGVPFALGNQDSYFWSGQTASGGGTSTLVVRVNIFGVDAVHSILNTLWGQAGASTLRIEFAGTGGAFAGFDLLGNVDVRDFHQNIFTNSINGTTTVNVFANQSGQRLDKQRFDLPDSFLSQKLTSITLIDTGSTNFQRAILAGLTAEIVPTPAASALLLPGVLFALRRRR
jgi:hypothetical protein